MPELVGDAELRGDVKHLCSLSAVRCLEQGCLGLWHEFVWTPWICHNLTPMKTCVFVLSPPRGLTLAVSRRPHPQTPAWEHAAAGGGRLQCVVRGWQGPPLGPL